MSGKERGFYPLPWLKKAGNLTKQGSFRIIPLIFPAESIKRRCSFAEIVKEADEDRFMIYTVLERNSHGRRRGREYAKPYSK
jgi:hypothetical protein